MTSSANLSRSETAERSAALTLRTAHVELDLRQAADTRVTGFPTRTTLVFDADLAAGDTTWVDFIGEGVHRVALNGTEQPVRYDGARVQVEGLQASNTLTVEGTGAYSRSGEGMHRFVDPADGATYLYTQYEPADSRRVMACFEQPDMKASYTFTVHAPQGWQVLSNQAVAQRDDDAEAGTQTVEFAPTLPISSYITAVAAGPYHRVESVWTRGDQNVPLSVLCRASLAEHLDADEIIEITRQGLDFYTEAFDHPYPWGTYDQVFVPEYNLGAMENPGLVTFTEKYVFRGASTTADHENRANTILHEMAHMWFGDLVTMRWWDDLWLKESFADFMGALVTAEATRFSDAWVTFANGRKAWAYSQDQLPTTHPIVADIVDLEAAKLNFDGITYAKGAAVLKQLVAFVGREAFFDGARRYFQRHQFGNTTLDDLLVELEETSGRDVRAWSRAWLQTSGVSTLAVEQDNSAEQNTASGADAVSGADAASGGPGWSIRQSVEPGGTLRPHRLAVAFYDLVEGRLVLRERADVEIDGERAEIDADAGSADLVLPNAGDLTFAKIRLDERSVATIERAFDTLEDPLARGLVWSALWNATRDGELAASRYLAIVRRFAPTEHNASLLGSVLGNAATALSRYVTDAEREPQRRVWLDAAWAALFSAAPGSDGQLAWARATASAACFDDSRATDILGMFDGTAPVPEGLRLDANLRWALLTALSATGRAGADPSDTARIDAELERDDTASGKTAHVRAAAARPVAEIRAGAWDAAWNDESLTNDHLDATIDGFRAGGRRDLTAPFDTEYFARIRSAWDTRSIEIARRLVLGLFPPRESLDLVDTWLQDNADAPAALVRLVTERRDHLARSLRVQRAQSHLER